MPPVHPVIGGYALQRSLGRGTHGEVFLARRPQQPPVALKLVALDGSDAEAARAAFGAAAATAQRLRHPHIVAVHDAGIDGRFGWLAMEYLAGGDLQAFTGAGRLLAPAPVLRLLAQLAAALAYAHRQGVVHRDVKPANVLLHDGTDSVKLADFGIARTADAMQTRTGLVPGSPAYMAPELLAGALPTPQSDLYALGVLTFELLTGQRPHDGHSMGELLRRVAREPAPALRTLRPELPPALEDLVARLLAKRAADRPVDGDAVAAELRAIENDFAPRP